MINKGRSYFMASNHHHLSFLVADPSQITGRACQGLPVAAVLCCRRSHVLKANRIDWNSVKPLWSESRRDCIFGPSSSLEFDGGGVREFWRSVSSDPGISLDLPGSATLKFGDNGSPRSVNGQGAYDQGGQSRIINKVVAQKMVVAVDIDEVLGSFLSALNTFIAARYASRHSVSEYHVYEFAKIWNCSYGEANIRVHEFFKTPYFKAGIHPIPGAQQALVNLSNFCSFSVVTSRQNAIRDHTIEWLEKHYPGMFQDVHFGNHFALDGTAKPKSEICRSVGAEFLIDDNPRYALECAEHGIKVLLFDYQSAYPWSKNDTAASHPLVTKVHNWEEVEGHLLSWQPSTM